MSLFIEDQLDIKINFENNFVDSNNVFKGKIIVFVPHMDDEVLGCGGTIAQLNNKDIIYFVFATDGTKSPYSKEFDNKELNKIRINESKSALKILGIPEKNLSFLNLPDYQLKNYFNNLTNEYIRIIEELNPDMIFTPFRYDQHPDHIAVRNSALRAHALTNSNALLFEYFVYTNVRM
ncbi:MAG: PIG-L family deacetylase, partial [Ignavibacteriaceae bacterium]